MPSLSLIALASLVPAAFALPLQLQKRIQPPRDLFGPTGKPNFWDVAQTTIPNCGWSATSAAIAYVNPDFLSGIITDNGDGESATFNIWDYPSYKKNPQVVRKSDLPDNANNKGPVWWSGGLEHAAVQAGREMGGISPGDSLAIQTGIKHKTVNTIHLQGDWGAKQDETWEILLRAEESPIIIDAMFGDFIVGNHAHAVLNATEEGGKRRVGLYNPWGGDGVFDYDEVWTQIMMVHHLANFERGPEPKEDPTPAVEQTEKLEQVIETKQEEPVATEGVTPDKQEITAAPSTGPESEGKEATPNSNDIAPETKAQPAAETTTDSDVKPVQDNQKAANDAASEDEEQLIGPDGGAGGRGGSWWQKQSMSNGIGENLVAVKPGKSGKCAHRTRRRR